MNNNNNNGGRRGSDDPARRAMEAARRAQEHANRAKFEAEREERLRRDEARENIPLVSNNKNSEHSHGGGVQPRRVNQNSGSGSARRRQPNSRRQSDLRGADPNEAGSNHAHQRNPHPPVHRNHNVHPQHNDHFDNYDQGVKPAGKAGLVIGRIISILLATVSLAVIVVMFAYNILPMKYRLVIAVTIVVINIIVFYLLSKAEYSRSSRIGGNTIGTISLIILLGISYLLYFAVSTLDSLNIEYELVKFDIRVMADSPLQTLADLNGKTVGIPADENESNLENAYKQLESEHGATVNTSKASNFMENVGSLYQGNVDAIFFNAAHNDSVADSYPDFLNQTRVLGTTEIKAPVTIKANRVNTSREGFSMFISGIDTYGEISTVSRSDVNIVVTVNPKTKKILMTSIPRDTYVEIAGTNGGYDKLTHAGIYGIETSVNTVSNFLGADMNYYSRVNFTSLIELVDILGGIEVENPVAFPTNDGNHYFEQGTISLNGDQALAFSRERYNLEGGDISRGQNQLRVIEGMIKKATSRAALQNIGPLMEKFNQVTETNMPTPDIMNIVNVSAEGESWNIEKVSLMGTGSTGELTSYSMPGSALYMYSPDPDSLTEIKNKINNILQGN